MNGQRENVNEWKRVYTWTPYFNFERDYSFAMMSVVTVTFPVCT